MLIGCMRVSIGEQNLDLQRDGLERAGCERVYDDVFWGRATERPGFKHINMLGRYAFTLPDYVARGELRPLRDPSNADGDDA
jgi:hypothetical protein